MAIKRTKQLQIIVYSCADCPFLCGIDTQTVRCFLDDDLRTLKYADYEGDGVGAGKEYPEKCPLKTNSVTAELAQGVGE